MAKGKKEVVVAEVVQAPDSDVTIDTTIDANDPRTRSDR